MQLEHDFHLRIASGEIDEAGRALLGAVRFGFNQNASSEENDRRWWATSSQDGHRLRYATRRPRLDGLGLEQTPVATFTSFTHTVNAGGGTLLEADFITDVTVRATDRRQGLLRRMMGDELAWAQQQGLALAALTVTEGSIYGRFGFGVATRQQRVELDTREHFALRHQPTAQVEQAAPGAIADLVDQLHEHFHAHHRGSMQPPAFRRPWLSGEWDWETMAPATNLRAAVAVRDGRPVGAVTYELAGRDEKATVVDLVGDDDAELALWRYLADLDLVRTVHYGCLQPGSPLRAALANPRSLSVKSEGDQIWIRLLDVVAALQARSWDGDGEVVLRVDDPMGLADGCWRITAQDGSATLTEADPEQAQLRCSVDVLSETYFGLTPLSLLAAAGRVDGEPAAIRTLGRMLAVDLPPRNTIVF